MFLHFGLLLAAIFLSGPVSATDAVGVGLNKFDLLKQYTGHASGGDGGMAYLRVTRAMGRKAIGDARDANVNYLRISATGYAPEDLRLWIESPKIYWAHIDVLMDDLDKAGVRGVFTFIWNTEQFPSLVGETMLDLMSKPDSRSALMAERYVKEFIGRYKERKTILFYELTNELNLAADLDIEARCRREIKGRGDKSEPPCSAKANFTTAQLIVFTRWLTNVIRSADPSRPVSSGFAMPRPSAEHLRAKPEWVASKADFTLDSVAQFEKNLADIHDGIDLISVHLYPTEGNRRFGASDRRDTNLLDLTKHAADKIGKPLFVGEFGDSEKLDGTKDSFTRRVLDRIAALNIPYSAVWAWEFYQRKPYITRDNQHTAYSLEPGVTDALIGAITATNERMGAKRSTQNGEDSTPPTVVLTWPLECSTILSSQSLHAVASDESGPVTVVEFWVDDRLLEADRAPPYEASVTVDTVMKGEHVIKARAFDRAGNVAEYHSRIQIGKPAPGIPCRANMNQ